MIIPPQVWLLSSVNVPSTVDKSSNSAVKMIGFEDVPTALIFAPRVMIKAEVGSLVGNNLPRTTVPGAMLSTPPASKNTLPSKMYSLSLVQL